MSKDYTLQPFPPFGMLAVVHEPHWAALAATMRANPNLSFDTGRYPYFDRVIAEGARIPALYNNLQIEYALYAGLRFNIAALRNQLATSLLGTSYTVADKRRTIPRLKNIAGAIGEAIANKDISPHTAAVLGAGAAEIYEYLLYVQDQPGAAAQLRGLLRKASGKRRLNFGLPPIETTPLSPANLAPKLTPQSNAAKELAAKMQGGGNEELRSLETEAAKLADIGEEMLKVAVALDNVDDLPPPAKEESVEEARKILRWLRNLQATDKDMEEWLAQGTPAATVSKASKLKQIVGIFVQMLQRKKSDSGDANVREAVEAIRAIALFVAEEGAGLLPNGPRADALNKQLDDMPEEWEKRSAQPVQRLLDIIEGALERMSGEAVSDLSIGEKIAQASANINKNLAQIRNVDAMQSPAREESVELAREILDKLKKLDFSSKSPKEMVETGKPEEKLAMAQKLDEGIEAYKNIVTEAAQKNPETFADERIREASESAACFAHMIALMAVKELPGSVAAAQSISSEAARDPDEWKKLHGATVGRLVASMEGGVEKAANDIQQEQEEQKQEEQGQDAAQEAQAASEGTRKKKRRRRSSSSSKGGGKARRAVIEMTADDASLKQGRFQEPSRERRGARVEAPAPAGLALNTNDLAAVREVAGSLMNVKDTKDLGITNVGAGDKITPDDKNRAERFADKEKQGAKSITPGKRN